MFKININSLFPLLALLILGSIPTEDCCAQRSSLWERRDNRMTDMFSDVKARRPGDLLVITIEEQSDVENRDQRTLRKQNSSSTEGTGSYGVGGGLGTAAGNLNFDQETAANRQFDGNTQFRSERGFTDRFTVQVVDTLPNGNLLVSGKRNMSLEGDNRTLVLSGIVRSVDVTGANAVSSRLVSNLTISYESNGQDSERKFINQGWLGRKINKIWP